MSAPRRSVVIARRAMVVTVFPFLVCVAVAVAAVECYRDFLRSAWKDAATDPEARHA